jgi:hypothetical protein
MINPLSRVTSEMRKQGKKSKLLVDRGIRSTFSEQITNETSAKEYKLD